MHKVGKVLFAIILFLSLCTGIVSASDTAMFRNDPQHSGNYTSVMGIAISDPRVIWTYQSSNIIISSPTVADGIVYFGSHDGILYAVNTSTGSLIWKNVANGSSESSPAVVNGVVYVGGNSNVYAYDALTGTRLWKFTTGSTVYSSPTVVNGVVYVGSYDQKVYAIDAASGSPLWNFTTGSQVYSSPTVVNNVVYFGSYDRAVYALNAATGSKVWNTTALYGGMVTAPAVWNGSVYINTFSGVLYALNASDGTTVWASSNGCDAWSSPLVVDGVVYIGSYGAVKGYNAITGGVFPVKTFATADGGYVDSSPTFANGIFYFGSGDQNNNNDQNIYAYRPDGSKIWSVTAGSRLRSAPSLAKGVLYIGSDDGKLYAISDASLAPIPGFSGTPVTGNDPLTVQFTDQTQSPGILAWNWSFGDGIWVNTTNPGLKNPVHTYANLGNYPVSLTIRNATGTNTTSVSNYINVIPRPLAGFSGTPTAGNDPLVVQFTDSSLSPGITAWNWSFGDGTWANITDAGSKNPSHTFASFGSYPVNLTVTNSTGTNTTSLSNYINVVPRPVAGFSGTPTTGNDPLVVQFTDSSLSPGITAWNWSFGDGTWTNTTDSASRNALHTYTNFGSYSVSLTITNTTGTNSTARPDYISVVPRPIAGFSGTPTAGNDPLVVQFADSSLSPGITAWNWSFGDGTWTNTTDAASRNALHTYTNFGSYSVSLTITNTTGTNSTARPDYIGVVPRPIAGFSGTPTTGNDPLVVQFTDSSLSPGITAWNWSFGDGTWTNTTDAGSRNPLHTFANLGSYSVSLTLTNTTGSNTTARPNYISVMPYPVANFTGTPTTGNDPLVVQFTDLSPSPDILAWNWSFGDGGWANITDAGSRNALHTYTDFGSYSVSLMITNITGTNTTARPDYIRVVPRPIAGFSGTPTTGNDPLVVQFTDSSLSPGITAWNWSFGDGTWTNTTDAASRNALHTYTNFGSYSVSLTITNSTGTNSTARPDYIGVVPRPIAGFSGTPTTGNDPLVVQFTDSSLSPGITAWNWSFGDGTWTNTTDAASRNALHTYTNFGSYSVSLTITNTTGTNSTARPDYIGVVPRPVAGFSGTPTTGNDPLIVQFTDSSLSPGITAWNWSFGDGTWTNTTDSASRNALHTYANFGSYSVSLTITNTTGTNSTTRSNFVTVIPRPVVNFTGFPLSGEAPLTVQFTDLSPSPGITAWNWSFGDGTWANITDPGIKNPSYTYTNVSSYTVSLTVTNSSGSNTTAAMNFITVRAPGQNGVNLTRKANLPPVFFPTGNKNAFEGSLLQFTVNATDPEGEFLKYSATNLPHNATFDPDSRTFAWTPAYHQPGSYPVTFFASDGIMEANETITITVAYVDRPPVLDPIEPKSVKQGYLLDFVVNASDPDGDPLTFSSPNLPSGSTLNSTSGAFRWLPGASQSGNFTVDFVASDGMRTDDKPVVINSIYTNYAPIMLAGGDRVVEARQSLLFSVIAFDWNNDHLTYSVTNLPDGASFDPENQIFSWKPSVHDVGMHNLTFSASDGSLMSSQNVIITVMDLPETPASSMFYIKLQ